jgi:hypothetical protein
MEHAHIDASHGGSIAKLRHTKHMRPHDILYPKHIVQPAKSFRHRYPESSRGVGAPIGHLVLLSACYIIKEKGNVGDIPEDKAC